MKDYLTSINLDEEGKEYFSVFCFTGSLSHSAAVPYFHITAADTPGEAVLAAVYVPHQY